MTARPSIFVQIASYRDAECIPTLEDLFAKARHPQHLHVGICWQDDMPLEFAGDIRVAAFRPEESRGVCWARAQAQALYRGEDYVLMIDSHMRFVEGWDVLLIEELARCPSQKPLLSTYPPGYTPPDNLAPDARPATLRAQAFHENGDIRFEAQSLAFDPSVPLRGAFIAAGFLFAPGGFVREVPYDPQIYFDHEEITLSLRAYTQGWDVFAPSRVFSYHYYNPGAGKPLHWKDSEDWVRLQSQSRALYQAMVTTGQGLGPVRSLQEFESFSGLDFKNRQAKSRMFNCDATILSDVLTVEDIQSLGEEALVARVEEKLFPAVERIFGFSPANPEGFRRCSHGPDDTDISRPGTAVYGRRRLAITVALNDNYEGGNMVFEGDSIPGRIPLGAALCYPCDRVHAIEPITKGQRNVLLAYLY